MFDKLSSIHSFYRLVCCLFLSVGLHGGLVFMHGWFKDADGRTGLAAPVEVTLVHEESSLPSDRIHSEKTPQKEKTITRPEKKEPLVAENSLTRSVIKPSALQPAKPVSSETDHYQEQPLAKSSKTDVDVCSPSESDRQAASEPVVASDSKSVMVSDLVASAGDDPPVKVAGNSQAHVDIPDPVNVPLIEAVPKYRNNPLPHYPYIARQKRWEGVVWLLVNVSSQGEVDGMEIEESCGYQILDKAASRSVKKWEFTPAMRAGIPVESQVRIPVRFKLEES